MKYKEEHIEWLKRHIVGKSLKEGREVFINAYPEFSNLSQIAFETMLSRKGVKVKKCKGEQRYKFRTIGGKKVYKHVELYKGYHGVKEIPKGNVIIFLDGNCDNMSKENLEMISKKEMGSLSFRKLRFKECELTKCGINIIRVEEMIKEKAKLSIASR